MNGAPGRTRTSCLRFRKPPLCPGELREQRPGRRRGPPERNAVQLRHDSRYVGRNRAKATSPCDGDLRSLSFKSAGTPDCPGRVSAALGCVPLSASPVLFERQSFQRPFGLGQVQSPLGGVKSATGFDRSLKSEVPSPFARALPERPVFEARGYRYCGT